MKLWSVYDSMRVTRENSAFPGIVRNTNTEREDRQADFVRLRVSLADLCIAIRTGFGKFQFAEMINVLPTVVLQL